MNVVNEIYLAENSHLKHYKLQNEAFKAAHISYNAVDVKANASYKSFCLQKGADMARNETYVLLSEEGAHASVDAAYIMNGWATIDTTTDIKHMKPQTTSSQLVKGVVGGQAKGVFQGKIHIAQNAVKTEGYQLHKAMLLSNEAEVDVKPELEIFADDVKCSHGSACGELDKEQLFYMQSRGISEQDAKQLLIDAYLNDVIAKVEDEKIIEWIKLSLNTNENK
jgi:Fe-S cluster assembly protein SufD